VRVRIVRPPGEEIVDGIALAHFKIGLVYSVPAALATLMVVEGWAEPVLDDAAPTLPPVIFHLPRRVERRRRLLTDVRLRRELGIAADRRRRS
jgi:hypothetical protein